jgi:hypothetical protein
MKAYKIVKVEKNGSVKTLTSCRVNSTMDGYFKIYADNGVTKTVNRGLAFKTLEQAENWLAKFEYVSEYEIWECQGRQISLPKRFVNLWGWADKDTWDAIRSFLLYGRKAIIGRCYDRIRHDSFPSGTVHLRDLKLTKRMVSY